LGKVVRIVSCVWRVLAAATSYAPSESTKE
jgi:hypothetical protein